MRHTTPAFLALSLLFVPACGGNSTAALYNGPPLDVPEHRIGVSDVLAVTIKDNADYSTPGATVRPDGVITVPGLGDVNVVGKTPDTVQKDIVRKASTYIRVPIVTVTLVELNSYEFFVIGNVRAPNRYTSGRLVTVMQALSMAGGLTNFAEPDDIVVLREFEDGQRRIPFHYALVLDGTRIRENIYLQTGDTVVVP